MMKIFGSGHKVIALTCATLSWGCLYGFQGGGLPGHIKTVAIIPFDNQTAEPSLTIEVNEAIREAVESRLGLRASSEETADAVVRGAILRYTPDIPLQFRGDEQGNVNVSRRRVQLSIRVEIFDQRENRMLWERPNLRVDGEYDPPEEQEGRQLALDKLVSDIVDGAQSQW